MRVDEVMEVMEAEGLVVDQAMQKTLPPFPNRRSR